MPETMTVAEAVEKADRLLAKQFGITEMSQTLTVLMQHVRASLPGVRDRLTQLEAALDGLTDIHITVGHPKYGIECTAVRGDPFATVINQTSVIDAIINARHKLDTEPDVGANADGAIATADGFLATVADHPDAPEAGDT